jgi:hypothetical protein
LGIRIQNIATASNAGADRNEEMRVTEIVESLRFADLAVAEGFSQDYPGLSIEECNLGWVAKYTSPDGIASVQLVTSDDTAFEDSAISAYGGSLSGHQTAAINLASHEEAASTFLAGSQIRPYCP